ncbi:MAG: Grx4 family monothiol glutaredoxin [Rickettsiales bacterium]|jgi:monothiol glutaredoxin|nr:Grx4 family monothiol glutaredoxin [Rickettsiales bacterium]
MTNNNILKTIESQIQNNDIVLYMKGTREEPQCGFSSAVSKLLSDLQLQYETVNVLDNPEIREAVKQYTDWPTIPQLYIKGEFVGGFDIVKEMHSSGDLQALLREKGLLSTT